MSVNDIENAITKLHPNDIAQLADWFAEFQAELWDKQLESDSNSGALDHLIAQATDDNAAGNFRAL